MTAVKVWPMDDGCEGGEYGAAIRTAGGADTARSLYAEWLTGHGHTPREAADAAFRCRAVEGWWRWTPCNLRSCFAGTQHRPGHIQQADGLGPGRWHGVLLEPR